MVKSGLTSEAAPKVGTVRRRLGRARLFSAVTQRSYWGRLRDGRRPFPPELRLTELRAAANAPSQQLSPLFLCLSRQVSRRRQRTRRIQSRRPRQALPDTLIPYLRT